MNEAAKYLKVPKIYVELLNLAGGLIFLLILNFSFIFDVNIVRNIGFLSGTEQSIFLFLTAYFSGVLIQALVSFFLDMVFVLFKFKLYLRKKLRGYYHYLGEKTDFPDTLKSNPTEIHQAEILKYLSENPILIAENAAIQKTIIILNFAFAYSVLLTFTASFYFLIAILLIIIISFAQRVESSELNAQAGLMMPKNENH